MNGLSGPKKEIPHALLFSGSSELIARVSRYLDENQYPPPENMEDARYWGHRLQQEFPDLGIHLGLLLF